MEQDIPGSAPKVARRNKLREVQAYQSDSSEDDFFSSARKSRAAAQDKKGEDGGEDDDDDMFGNNEPAADKSQIESQKNRGRDAEEGESSDEDDVDGVSKKSRKVRFLDISEIEGQELHPNEDHDIVDSADANAEFEDFMRGQALSTSSSVEKGKQNEMDLDEEGEQEEEELDPEIGLTGSRLHAPQVEAFNMRADLEDGAIDEDGNYIRTSTATSEKADEAHDAWLAGLSSSEIKAAKKADEARKERERQHEWQSIKEQEETTAAQLMATLMEQLEIAETPLEALARLAPGKKVKRNRNRRKMAASTEQENPEEQEKEKLRKEIVEVISDAADKLLNRGVRDIYDLTREQLARAYARDTGEQWQPPKRFHADGEE